MTKILNGLIDNSRTMLWIQLVILIVPIFAVYIPPGPRYECPKDGTYIYPCSCVKGADSGLFINCENTNLASLSLAFANLGNEAKPIEELVIQKCDIGK